MSVSLSYPTGMRKFGDVESLVRMLNISSTIEKRDIIQNLGEIRSRKAVMPLIELLEDKAVIVRSSSAWALGEIGDARATLPLIGLLNDESENVRVQAAWALGRIGDMRAIQGLKSIMKEGAPELKKIARESITRLESINDELYKQKYDGIPAHSRKVDIPLLTIDVPADEFECEYISRVEDGSKNGNNHGINFSKDVVVDDSNIDSASKNKRRITLGLKNTFEGLVSVDILFSYVDQNNGGHKNSVWLQLANNGHDCVSGNNYTIPPIPETAGYKDEQTGGTKKTQEHEIMPPLPLYREYVSHEPGVPVGSKKEIGFDNDFSTGTVSEKYREPLDKDLLKVKKVPDALMSDPIKTTGKTCIQQEVPHTPVVSRPENVPVGIPDQHNGTYLNIDSAIGLLNNIGNSGMVNAASTVIELIGQDESIQSHLRIIPVDEMKNEIFSLGEEIVLIDVKLHGNHTNDISGKLMFYLSRDVALKIANDLLSIPPDEAVIEFTEDIISTVKESANIFGGQYISAISEFIEVPITLNAPEFKTGNSAEIAEINTKEVSGKVEFALATDINFGDNKTGRLIILLDPGSFDTIIQKLF